MLNRRHLRVKALHYLYAAFQGGNYDLAKGEKELLSGLDKVYELYLYFLSLIPELTHYAQSEIDLARNKMLPTAEDLNPNLKFVQNKVSAITTQSAELNKLFQRYHISWQNEPELIKKIFGVIKKSPSYLSFMQTEPSFENDKKLWLAVFQKQIFDIEQLQFFFEEKSIVWADDFETVYLGIQKTLQQISEDVHTGNWLQPLFKDEESDRSFVIELYRKTLINSDNFEKLIIDKTENWELERIAVMDILLMKMAITEAITFQNIPVKVSLNEYIELAKSYSSPSSKNFINGILDKIFTELVQEGKIIKTGRGLVS